MVGVIFGGHASVLSDSESVSVLCKDLLNLEPPLCDPGYAPADGLYINACMHMSGDQLKD